MKQMKLWLALIAILILGIITSKCKKDDYEEITGECPIVVSTNPTNLETGVTLDKIITVTFNTKMDEATITQAAFTLHTTTVKDGNAEETSVNGTITYNAENNTMSFTPSTHLTANTTYTGKVFTSVKEIHGNALQTPYIWTFSTGSFVLPTVISTVPRNAAVNIAINTKISATFSESMDPLTLNQSTFTLKHGTTVVDGAVTYFGTTSTFSPSGPLAANTLYTATITTGAKNTAGVALGSNYVWTFTTGSASDATAPIVISTFPENLATDVGYNSSLLATFSEAMDPLSITDASFTLKNGTIAVPGAVTYTGVVATLKPFVVLLPNTLYTATITTMAKDLAGNQMEQNYVWTFTTGIIPDDVAPTVIVTVPENLATNVAINARPSAIFSEPMNPFTINQSTFIIKHGETSVSGVVTYSGLTAVFSPLSNLAANTVYTATITNAAEDLAGNKMINNYIWSFTTGSAPDNTPPTVIAVYPTNYATDVAVITRPTATFSELMDPLTINAATFVIKQGSTPIAGSVAYIGVVATFTPGSNFAANTVYTATITNSVEDLAGNTMLNDFVWTFTTAAAADMTPPNVISTFPVNLATNVSLNVIPTATFSELMDPSTINATSFTLKQGVNTINGVVTYEGTTATFAPASSLTGNTLYTATIVNTVKDLAGNNMVNNYVWTFTTGDALDITPPTVTSTIPANLATNVPTNVIPTATFSELMDPLTINASTFKISQGGTPISGVISYAGLVATFTPGSNFAANTVYTATITNNVEDLAGNAMVNDYVWTFTTAAAADITPPNVISTFPVNLATNVPINVIPTATFSELMDPSTINATSFTLQQGVNTINGVVSYAGTTATFAPASSLAGNTLYTATIVNTVKDLAGNNMVNNYVWTFTTGNAPDLTPPTVISTIPVNLATNVPTNVIPTAVFSELMDPSTINATSFTLQQGVNTINGVVSYAGTTATFAPASSLAGNTLYTATIVNTVKDLAGNNMVNNYVWTFTTVSNQAPTVISTDPENLASNVQLNKVITADFSEMMNPMTINNESFTLKIGNTPVAGQVSYSGLRASFAPSSNLVSGTTYIATITTAAQNLAGVSLESNYVWTFTTVGASGAPFVDLKSVGRFGIIAGVGIANNAGFSVINDQDVGISPGVRSSVTGFPPAIVVNGAIYASDDIAPPGVAAMLIEAKQDLTDAYLFAEGATVPAPATVSGDQGGLTLYPGIYKSTSTLLIQSGDLTLDAQGDENAVWIFQIASGFTTVGGAGGNVILSGGAQAKNIFWQTGTSATVGDNTSFKGNILALTSITMNSGAVAQGRMLCINGAIVLTNTNIINKP